MSLIKIKSESLDLTDNYAFTGTVTGAGGGKVVQVVGSENNATQDVIISIFFILNCLSLKQYNKLYLNFK